MEILLVCSLISLVNLALYNSFANGLKVWKKIHQLVIEEDILIFLDKLTADLRNAYYFSQLTAQGTEHRFTFPTIVHVSADPRSGLPEGTYVHQMGQVEYYFDGIGKKLYRRQANYGQALQGRPSDPIILIKAIEDIKFRYFYLTDQGEKMADHVLETLPSRVEVEMTFTSHEGKRVFSKSIDLPINS